MDIDDMIKNAETNAESDGEMVTPETTRDDTVEETTTQSTTAQGWGSMGDDTTDAHTDTVEHHKTETPEPQSTPRRSDVSVPKISATDANIVVLVSAEIAKLKELERTAVAKILVPTVENPTPGEMIVATINAHDDLVSTLENITHAKGLEPVDRAFYIMEQDTQSATWINNLLSAFDGDEYNDQDRTKIALARHIVTQIENLSDEYLSYIKKASALLSTATEIVENNQ